MRIGILVKRHYGVDIVRFIARRHRPDSAWKVMQV